MLAWVFSGDRKAVTVLRLTSIDKLTDLELYLSASGWYSSRTTGTRFSKSYHSTTLIATLRRAVAPFFPNLQYVYIGFRKQTI